MAIEYNNYVKNLRDDDVLDIDNQLFKAEKFKSALEESFNEETVPKRFNEHIDYRGIKTKYKGKVWFEEGVDCKILKAGDSGWRQGKLKINVTVEFIPDEPEIPEYQSPLDEIRNHPSFPNS
jgi:hypothetical protein